MVRARSRRRLRRLRPLAWADVEPADLVCLNAGVVAKGDGTVDDYRGILGVNVDGVASACRRSSPAARGARSSSPRRSPASSPSSPTRSTRRRSTPSLRLRALDGAGVEPRGIRINLVCLDRAHPDDRRCRRPGSTRRLPAAGAGADRRGSPRRGAERADRSGLGVPAGPRADALPLPRRPRPTCRGRRRDGAEARRGYVRTTKPPRPCRGAPGSSDPTAARDSREAPGGWKIAKRK